MIGLSVFVALWSMFSYYLGLWIGVGIGRSKGGDK